MISDLKVEVKKLKKILKALKDNNQTEASFEFIVGSCFPTAWKNIQEELRRQYTMGYSDGLKDKETSE